MPDPSWRGHFVKAEQLTAHAKGLRRDNEGPLLFVAGSTLAGRKIAFYDSPVRSRTPL
jgi:hypothetical protein